MSFCDSFTVNNVWRLSDFAFMLVIVWKLLWESSVDLAAVGMIPQAPPQGLTSWNDIRNFFYQFFASR